MYWCGHSFSNGISIIWVCTVAFLQRILMVGICTFWCGFLAHARGTPGSYTSYPLSRVALCYSNNCSPHIYVFWWGIQLWGLIVTLHTWWWGPLVPLDDTVNSKSVVGIKPGDSDVVIGYQLDNFSYTWVVEYIVAMSQIYLWFMDKVSTLAHFPLELGCENYTF